MKNLFLPFVLLSFASFTSCEKEKPQDLNDTNGQIENNNTLMSEETLSDLEMFGIWHNEAMDYVGDIEGFEEFGMEELSDNINNFNVENGNEEVAMENIAAYGLDGQITMVELASEMSFSEEGIAKMSDFEKNLIDLFLLEEYDINSVVDEFKDYEFEIFTSDLSDFEKEVLIGSSIIARYSSIYWDDANADESNPWHELIQEDNLRASESHFPLSISAIGLGRIGDDEIATLNGLPLRVWADIHGFIISWLDTQGGIFDDHARRVFAFNSAYYHSAQVGFN